MQGLSLPRRSILGAVGALTASVLFGGTASGSLEGLTGRTVSRELSSEQQIPSPEAGLNEPKLRHGVAEFAGATQPSDPPEKLRQVWKQEFDAPSLSMYTGTSESDHVFMTTSRSDETTIHTLKRSDGTAEWSQTVKGEAIVSIAHEPGRALYHSDPNSGAIVARSISDGSELWSKVIPPEGTGSPVCYQFDSKVYVVEDNKVIALDNSDGSKLWSTTMQKNISPTITDTYDDGETSLLYLVSNDSSGGDVAGRVTALDSDSGTKEWIEKRPDLARFLTLTASDAVYCSVGLESTSELVSLDAKNGTVNWKQEREDDLPWSLLKTDPENSVYAEADWDSRNGLSDGELVKFDSDGSMIWRYDAGAVLRASATGIDAVYIATADGRIESIIGDSTSNNYGETGWSKSLGSEIVRSGLHLGGGVLCTGTTSDPGVVYALSADDGSELDSYTLDNTSTKDMDVIDGKVWVTGESRNDSIGDSALYILSDSGGGGDRWYTSYINENKVVNTSGLNRAIQDYFRDDLSNARLNTVIQSYVTGTPIGGVGNRVRRFPE